MAAPRRSAAGSSWCRRRYRVERQQNFVVADVLPEIVERPVVEDAEAAADDAVFALAEQDRTKSRSAARNRRYLRRRSARCRSPGICSVAAARRAVEIAARSQHHQRIFHAPRILRRAEAFIAQAVVQRQARGDTEAVLRKEIVLRVGVAAVEIRAASESATSRSIAPRKTRWAGRTRN